MILWLLLLAACGAQPAPEFFGAERREIDRGAHRYVLFLKENRFEVIRLGPYVARGPPRAQHQQIMQDIVEAESGCRINQRRSQGDAGEMRGTLLCSKRRS